MPGSRSVELDFLSVKEREGQNYLKLALAKVYRQQPESTNSCHSLLKVHLPRHQFNQFFQNISAVSFSKSPFVYTVTCMCGRIKQEKGKQRKKRGSVYVTTRVLYLEQSALCSPHYFLSGPGQKQHCTHIRHCHPMLSEQYSGLHLTNKIWGFSYV